MPAKWIDSQSESVRHWLRESACPMIASTPDGGIVWANEATERLLGYSVAELVSAPGSPGKSWEDLTVDLRDLAADQAMVQALVSEEREDYQLQKSYRAKDGTPVPCMIHVLRWPPHGPLECCLVTLMPLGAGSDFMVVELVKLRRAIADMNARPAAAASELWPLAAKIGTWANENKLAAAAVLLWISTLLAGDRVLMVAERIKILVWP